MQQVRQIVTARTNMIKLKYHYVLYLFINVDDDDIDEVADYLASKSATPSLIVDTTPEV